MSPIRRSFFLLVLGAPLAVLRLMGADPVDLAADLGYLRVHSIALERATIGAALAKSRALVLDLRYPLDERDAGETLRSELARRPATARLYVLVSPQTPVPVVGAVASATGRVITLGVKGSRPEPAVAVRQSADEDRRAYDAWTGGTPLADLVSGKVEKERFDEATLVQEFRHGVSEPPPAAAPASPTEDTTPRLTDRVLQRALHLHRSLQALRR